MQASSLVRTLSPLLRLSAARTNRRRVRGSALIVTLVAIAITTLIGAAIATLIVQHNNRANIDKSAARALDLAEAALNYQTQRIWATIGAAQVQYNGSNVESATYGLQANPLPVSSKKYNGSNTTTLNDFLGLGASDSCVCWIVQGATTNTLNLNSTTVVNVYGQATVNGITRTVTATAGGTNGSVFSKWAIFANGPLGTLKGSLTVTPTSGPVVGIVGSNTSIDVQKSGSVGGQIIYGSGTPDPDFAFAYGGPAIQLPTIDELANAAYLAGSYTTPNTNNGIAKFSLYNDNLTKGTTKSGSGIPTNGSVNGNSDYPLTLNGKAGGANFYLTSLDGSKVAIYANVANGPVNLWVSSTGNPDKITGNGDIIAYTTTDSKGVPIPTLAASSKFHIYYSNPNNPGLSLRGNGNFYADIYAYNIISGTEVGSLDVSSDVTVNGAIVVQTISGQGNFNVNYPSSAAPSISDGGGLLFRITTPWQEVNPARGN